MTGRQVEAGQKVIILLAPEFDEAGMIACLVQMRGASLPVYLVGVVAGLMRGKHGLMVRPDYSLDELKSEQAKLIVVPSGMKCSTSLMSDPRIHRLLNSSMEVGHYVAVLRTAEEAMKLAGFPQQKYQNQMIGQGEADIGSFIRELVHLVSGVNPI
ncbi:MAG: DJ-1/PfpI family protein [Chloroflexi bacterium]|nr:DJ-1/PfpI family protein [Chloroflexota bacterium]